MAQGVSQQALTSGALTCGAAPISPCASEAEVTAPGSNEHGIKAAKSGACASEASAEAPKTPFLVTRHNLNDLLVETFNSILRIEERSLRSNPLTEGLSISEIHTLCSVGLHERNPMKVIAERLNVTMATLNAALNRLEKRGFVLRGKNEQDRRQVLVGLTVKGRKVVRVHDAFHRKMVDNALADLTDDEADAMARAVANLKRFFDVENEKGGQTA